MEKGNVKLEESENKEINKKHESENENIKTTNTEKEQKNKMKIIPIIIISILILIGIIFSTIFALININNSNIVSGVKIQGIDVSGLTKEEAKAKIELIYNEKKQKDIILKYEEYEGTINPELIETNYDIEKAVEEAISIGKNNNIFVNNYNILFALIGKKDINIDLTINQEIAKETIENIGSNIPGAIIESDYYIENENLIITKGKAGIKVDTENIIKDVKNILKEVNRKQEFIFMTVINKEPEKIDIDKIHEEIYKEVKDAYYTKDPFTIYPEVEGIDFNVEDAKKLIEAEEKEQYIIKLTITKPKITISQIGSEAFPDLLATYTTRYDASNRDRTTNLRIACQKINDKVVLPGEVFSYNQALGVRSVATGYKNAKVYENGEVVDGIGGGICQISSTLYNSVLMSNMEATERRNHQFVTSYTPAGRDATVVYGMTDFKFKNTRKNAIKIKASISNGIATVSIYGIKEENEYIVSFSTRTISTIPFTVKYVDDSTLPIGTEKVKQNGGNGVITETYISKSLNGKVVSTKLLSKDTYNAMQKIILRGTKGSISNQTQPNVEQTPTPTPPTQPTQPEVVTPPTQVENPDIKDDTNTQENPETNEEN